MTGGGSGLNQGAGRSASILVVDDNRGDFILLRHSLERAGGFACQLDWVGSFDEAWNLMTTVRHDAYIVDRHIGDHDGIDLIRNARANGMDEPMILLTGAGSPDTDRAALDAGATDYVEKGRYDDDRIPRSIRYALERQRAVKRAQWLSTHDRMTGLLNRQTTRDRLGEGLGRARRSGRKLVIFYINISRFREINRSLGNLAGDAILIELAQRLRQIARPHDMVARLGGDEFVLLAEEIEVADAHQLARSLAASMAEPFMVGAKRHDVSVHAGAVIFPDDGSDLETLIIRSDAAARRARDDDSVAVHFWHRPRQMRFQSSRYMLDNFDGALDRGEFVLHYQPVYAVDTKSVVAVEALLRWQHINHGLLTPAEFMPALRRSEHLPSVGRWVIKQALDLAAQASRRAAHPLIACVNMSAEEFTRDDMGRETLRAAMNAGLPAGRLQVELKVKDVALRPDAIGGAVDEFRALGFRVALDGFGSDAVDLSELLAIPFDAVKIDKRLIDGHAAMYRGDIVARAVVGMWRALGAEVWATGIDSRSAIAKLHPVRCQFGQGYAFCGPLSTEAILARLAQSK